MDIDYTQKIQTFKLLTDYNDDEIALNYLEKTNWNEQEAAMLFEKENRSGSQMYHQQRQNIYQNNSQVKPNQTQYNYNQPQQQQQQQTNTLSKEENINTYKEIEIKPIPEPSRGFFSAISSFFSPETNESTLFKCLGSNVTKSIENFYKYISNRLGIILLYNKKEPSKVKRILQQIMSDEFTRELFTNSNKTILPINIATKEGIYFTSFQEVGQTNFALIAFKKKLYPKQFHHSMALLGVLKEPFDNNRLRDFLLKASSVREEPPTQTITSNTIPQNIPQQPINQNYYSNYVPQPAAPKKPSIPTSNTNKNNTNNNSNNNINPIAYSNNIDPAILNEIPPDLLFDNNVYNDINRYQNYQPSNGEIIAQQNREMEMLEKQQRLKEEENRRLEREEQMKKEKEETEKIISENQRMNLPPEPSDDDPDKTVIQFRYPDCSQVKTRKFRAYDTVDKLYAYIQSLGREIFTEDEYSKFEIIQTFPFKKFVDRNKTLIEEGLVPSAMLQIKEIEEDEEEEE